MPTATAEQRVADATDSKPTLLGRLQATVPAQSYLAFRVAFGLLVTVGQLRFVARGWVDEFYLSPTSHLTYPGFGWVGPLPPPMMYAVVVGMAVVGMLIACGIRTRLAAAVFVVGFGYCELIDAALYLNHYWFMTLAAMVLALVPTVQAGNVPTISVWALRTQLGVVYVFAGLAKLNTDWLLRAEPLQTWLAARTDRPIVGSLLDEPLVAFAFSWAGAAFDLTIVGWLLWRRTRVGAYTVLVVFHLTTAVLFQIGMFPWVMIALTPIFFSTDWPRRLAPRQLPSPLPRTQISIASTRPVSRPTLVMLAALMAVNIALPLRHVAAEGNVRWNDDGYLLAWRVMLTERATHVVFEVTDPYTGVTTRVGPEHILDEWQAAAAMVRADLILATAHLIADDVRAGTGVDVEVRADAFVAWNGRLRQQWIDPDVDLAALPRSSPSSAYVLAVPSDD